MWYISERKYITPNSFKSGWSDWTNLETARISSYVNHEQRVFEKLKDAKKKLRELKKEYSYSEVYDFKISQYGRN